MIAAIDGISRVITLDASASESVPELYSAFADAHNANLEWLPAFETLAQLPLVPVYATLINGWRIRMQSTGVPYIKRFAQGFIQTDDGTDPFVTNGGVEPRIRFDQPVLAVGYNTGGAGSIPSADKQEIIEGVWNKVLP